MRSSGREVVKDEGARRKRLTLLRGEGLAAFPRQNEARLSTYHLRSGQVTQAITHYWHALKGAVKAA